MTTEKFKTLYENSELKIGEILKNEFKSTILPDEIYKMANDYLKKGDLNFSTKLFEHLIDMKKIKNSNFLLSILYTQIGLIKSREIKIPKQKQKEDDSIFYFDKAINFDKNNYLALLLKGGVLAKNKKFDPAIKCFDDVIKIFPSDPRPYLGKGIILIKKKIFNKDKNEKENGLEFINKGIEILKKKKTISGMEAWWLIDGIYHRHLYFIEKRNWIEALEDIDQLIYYYNKNKTINMYKIEKIYYNKAYVKMELNDNEEAIKFFEECLKYSNINSNKNFIEKSTKYLQILRNNDHRIPKTTPERKKRKRNDETFFPLKKRKVLEKIN